MGIPDIESAGKIKPVHQKADLDRPVTEVMEDAIVSLTDEDNKRIKRKTDKVILTILTWVYFLQVLDKAVLGTSSVFNLQEDLSLEGSQYSLIGSISPIAQLGWQPFSAWIVVKVPARILMPTMILGWGIAAACFAACSDFGTAITARFFLGLFEAGCMPLFTVMTGKWYRRVEQPIRLSIWYAMNGTATMVASALSYGLGHLPTNILKTWQTIYITVGLLTIITAPFVYWKVDNDVTSARFLTEYERLQAVERLRANHTTLSSTNFEWSQVLEMLLEPKSWLWVAMALLPNMGSAMTSIFGPLIVQGFGFDKFETSLLNIPFGAVQTLVIIASCWASYKAKLKYAVLIAFMLPVVAGIAMLYAIPHTQSNQASLLAAYYLCAFLFAANPILLSWVVANTAGAAKTSSTMAFYQIGTSAGALAGPLLFTDEQAPGYLPGTRAVLGLFIALIGCIVIQFFVLAWLNRRHKNSRIRNGKSAEVVDQSMQNTVEPDGKVKDHVATEETAFIDLTDRQNDEFVYIY